MQIVRIFDCPGWTAEQYDELISAMGLDGRSAPGVLFHVAGPTEAGFQAVDVYESREAADRLAGEVIGPIAGRLGLTPPAVSEFPVHATLHP